MCILVQSHYWLQSYRVTELQTPKGTQFQVGEIFLCLISINSPTCFARRGIIFFDLKNKLLNTMEIPIAD